jgi:superfamily I DNA and/or RNA helicase
VALTRAKSRFYVIGNRENWRTFPGFDVLAEELRTVDTLFA